MPPAISLLLNSVSATLPFALSSRSISICAIPFSPRSHCAAEKGVCVSLVNSFLTCENSPSVKGSPSSGDRLIRLICLRRLFQRAASVLMSFRYVHWFSCLVRIPINVLSICASKLMLPPPYFRLLLSRIRAAQCLIG
jgi:hypothetical protein